MSNVLKSYIGYGTNSWETINFDFHPRVIDFFVENAHLYVQLITESDETTDEFYIPANLYYSIDVSRIPSGKRIKGCKVKNLVSGEVAFYQILIWRH